MRRNALLISAEKANLLVRKVVKISPSFSVKAGPLIRQSLREGTSLEAFAEQL